MLSETHSKIDSTARAFPDEQPEKKIGAGQILRLIQNSRRIPPAAFVSRRDPSILLSCARAIGAFFSRIVSRFKRKPNLYEELARTIDEITSGPNERYEELAAGKKTHRRNHKSAASDKKYQAPDSTNRS